MRERLDDRRVDDRDSRRDDRRDDRRGDRGERDGGRGERADRARTPPPVTAVAGDDLGVGGKGYENGHVDGRDGARTPPYDERRD